MSSDRNTMITTSASAATESIVSTALATTWGTSVNGANSTAETGEPCLAPSR